MRKCTMIKNKLRSERGVSLSVALLYFLVCAVLASMMVAAATSANGRIATVIKNKQADLAALSGARLTADALKNDAVIIVEQAEIDTEDDEDAGDADDGADEKTDFNFLSRNYYESDDTADAGSKTSLEDFTEYTEIKDDKTSILSGEIRSLYEEYLNTLGNDTEDSFFNGRLSMASGKNILKRNPDKYAISIEGNDSLSSDAEMTLSTDMTIDVKVTSGDSVCYVHCVPVINTYFQYIQAEDGAADEESDGSEETDESNESGDEENKQTVIKTTIITFPEVRLSRT